MYCRHCGNEINEGDAFCPKCGKPQNEENKAESNTNPQAEITQRLKPYKKLKQCTCLDCGYTGLMGVVRKQKMPIGTRVFSILIYAIALGILYGLFGMSIVTFLLLGVVIGIVDFVLEKKVLFCPSCCKEVNER